MKQFLWARTHEEQIRFGNEIWIGRKMFRKKNLSKKIVLCFSSF